MLQEVTPGEINGDMVRYNRLEYGFLAYYSIREPVLYALPVTFLPAGVYL